MTSKDTFYNRTQNLVGIDGINKLRNSKVAVFGVGGVGGYVAETLARTGVGSLVLIDGDEVNITNSNHCIADKHRVQKDGRDEISHCADKS